mgnify:FL=1
MKILVITGSRADWGLLAPVLVRLREDPRFDLVLVVTGQHLVPSAQSSLTEISKAGFGIDAEIDMMLGGDDKTKTLPAAMGRATTGVGHIINQINPNLMLVLGDRYEILAAVSAALLCNLPVAHLCGGDVTEGAMDDSIRHAITKMSSLHFVTTDVAARRVAQMGEDPLNIHIVGSTGLDQIRETPTLTPNELWADLKLAQPQQSFLITFHPATLSQNIAQQCDELIAALKDFPDATLIITGSNADPGAHIIDQKMSTYAANRNNAVFRTSLGPQKYYTALSAVNVVIGNSSSGLYEAPSFDVPTVNIGDRQAGRTRATSVIDCNNNRTSITSAIKNALRLTCIGTVNPYGDGHSAQRIVETLSKVAAPTALIRKKFVDLAQ